MQTFKYNYSLSTLLLINISETINVVPKTLFYNSLALFYFVYLSMFIRKVVHKSKKNKKYIYYRLVENIRVGEKVKQHTFLHLGNLDLAEEKHPLLAKRIEEYLSRQLPLFNNDHEIESLAFYYAQQIRNKESVSTNIPMAQVMLDTLEASDSRTIGAEQVGWSWFKYLEMNKLFHELGFTARQINLAALSILGRLIHPGSELSTLNWARELSGLGELLPDDFSRLSKNSLYEIADRIYEHKNAIEHHLNEKEKSLFNLKEHIILYDLTNTYLEGSGTHNAKAKFGRSKEKRHDCRLITMGLVVDEQGFVKKSCFFSGNQSEAQTLKEMVFTLACQRENADNPITVVIDAGIATEENLAELKSEGIHYIAVSRRRYPIPQDQKSITIRDTAKEKIQISVIEESQEKVLYVHSRQKAIKECSISSKFEILFETSLESIKEGLHKPHYTKRYEKIVERIGRLKERYRQVSSYYEVAVKREGGLAVDVQYRLNSKKRLQEKYSGGYFLRTNRLDLDEQIIWEIYNLIRRIEKSFESLKSDLGFRPIYHQKENRSDAHLFISVLAYHLLNSIEQRLRRSGDKRRWSSIRTKLSSHTRVTVSLGDKHNKTYRVRLNVKPNEDQRRIYRHLLVTEIMLQPKLIPD